MGIKLVLNHLTSSFVFKFNFLNTMENQSNSNEKLDTLRRKIIHLECVTHELEERSRKLAESISQLETEVQSCKTIECRLTKTE